jgi:hypothetical protein
MFFTAAFVRAETGGRKGRKKTKIYEKGVKFSNINIFNLFHFEYFSVRLVVFTSFSSPHSSATHTPLSAMLQSRIAVHKGMI